MKNEINKLKNELTGSLTIAATETVWLSAGKVKSQGQVSGGGGGGALLHNTRRKP